MADSIQRSCVDCPTAACESCGTLPAFCQTKKMTEEDHQRNIEAFAALDQQELLKATARVSSDSYNGRWTRVHELVAMCRAMGWNRIGIASCTAMQEEQAILGRILRQQGFEVFGVACKVGSIGQNEIGVAWDDKGYRTCNPLKQAEILNAQNTDINLIVGLCIGHDMLFQQRSQAPTTVMAVRDFATRNNPCAVLYDESLLDL